MGRVGSAWTVGKFILGMLSVGRGSPLRGGDLIEDELSRLQAEEQLSGGSVRGSCESSGCSSSELDPASL